MHKLSFTKSSVVAVILATVIFGGSASASSIVLKKGMQGNEVVAFQKDLINLGYFDSKATGLYGDLTVQAVKKLQGKYGYSADGIAGSSTLKLVSNLSSSSGNDSAVKTTAVQNSSGALKMGAQGEAVTSLQKSLKALGFLSAAPTGYFGSATEAAVIKLQKKYGFESDGIAGSKTLALVKKLANGDNIATAAKVSTTASSNTLKVTSTASASKKQSNYMLPWFSKVSSVFSIGTVATVYDIKTGLSFKVKRTYGHNHADCEALTSKDTSTMKKIFGGSWNWSRRAVIVSVNGTKIAASLDGMPHAGLDKYSTNSTVSSRSGGFGRGENLDAIKGNNMNGHFDIHFYGSRTHGTNKIDSEHQRMVKAAAQWALSHY